MRNTVFQSVPIPLLPTVVLVYTAPDVPMRVVLRETTSVVTNVIVGFNDNDVAQINGEVFFLQPDATIELVLAPRQSLWATSTGNPHELTLSASEALPIGKW
jgi:hypothetical protein